MDSQLLRDLKKLLGPDGVLHKPDDLLLYEYDGSVEVAKPNYVVFPRTATDVVGIVQLANRHNIPLVGRGAGTGLSGGAIARKGGIITAFSRMNRILEIDAENQRARVQPGVVNSDLSVAVAYTGLHFAPDPSSQKACTIGGNVSENSGGPHTLAYGVTTNHVLAMEVVLPSGELIHIGNPALDSTGYDLTGVFVGSEGTFGLVTEITVKLVRLPEVTKTLLAVFDSVDDATETVVEITARGITPAACEMLDGWTIRAVEAYVHAGFPLDCAAILLIDVDGVREEAEAHAEEVAEVCRLHRAREVRAARDARERDLLWKVIVPASLPMVIAGLRLGIGRALTGVVVGELFGATAGLGFSIAYYGGLLKTIREKKALDDAVRADAKTALDAFKERFMQTAGAAAAAN